jgi:adenosylcobinamide-phosphate synthase
MGWIAIVGVVLTLLLEQARPLVYGSPVHTTVARLAAYTQRSLNAGKPHHGGYAWVALVIGACFAVGLLYFAAYAVSGVLALAVTVAVLYCTLGFRQFSHHFSEIQLALSRGDVATARSELTQWKRGAEDNFSAAELDADELTRQSIEHGLLLAHRHVFGVFFWFALLAWLVGPVGAVLYRLAEYVARSWNRPPAPGLPRDRFGDFARRAFEGIDWLPVRLSALSYAIVGDFEGAVYCWRQVVRHVVPGERPSSRTLLLAAAGGALGMRVLPTPDAARILDEPGNEGAALNEPEPRMLRSAVGLVWRTLVLWLAMLVLLTLAGWLG